MQKFKRILFVINAALGLFIVNLLIIAVALFILGAVVMWLWNITVPDVFGLPAINIWQTISLIVLVNILLLSVKLSKYSDKK